jgi:hypothetical protein
MRQSLRCERPLPEKSSSHRFGESRGVKSLWNGGTRGCPLEKHITVLFGRKEAVLLGESPKGRVLILVSPVYLN